MKKNKGFTLIELMVTIAVLAIVAMMAAPSFGDLIAKRKLDAETRGLSFVLSHTCAGNNIKSKCNFKISARSEYSQIDVLGT